MKHAVLIAYNTCCAASGCYLAYLALEHGNVWAGLGAFMCLASLDYD